MTAPPDPVNEFIRTTEMLDAIVTVDAVRLATGLPIVDRNRMLAFSGRPDGATVWLIFDTDEERGQAWARRAEVGDQVRGLLAERGYPPAAARSVHVSLASRPQIERAGGPDAFYR